MLGKDMIHVLLVDSHELTRAGLRRILEECPAIGRVTEVDSGEKALRSCRSTPPHIVVLDSCLPGLSVFEVTARLARIGPGAHVIVLAEHAKAPYPTRLLDAGARAYLTKDCPSRELLEAVEAVYRGQRFISAEAARQLALSILPGTAESPFDELSARELEVMLKLTEGKRIPDIASLLCLSPKTVATYKYRIYDKLGTRNDVDLVRMAMRYGLVEPPGA